MKASSKTAPKRKAKSQMDEVDTALEKADLSEVTTKHAFKMAEIHESREK